MWLGPQQAVIKRELIGDVTLEPRRAVDGTAGGEKQMMPLAQIDDRSDVKRRADVGEVGFIIGLMIKLHTDEDIG